MKRWIARAYYTVVDWLYVIAMQVIGVARTGRTDRYLDPPGPRRIPVIVIPGIYEPWQYMLPLTDALWRAGHPVHAVATLGYNTGTIPQMAGIVQRYIDRLDAPRVAIVAHSKGGLIGKHLLANHNQDARIAGLAALNTPFGGSMYALYAPIPGVRIFAPDDAVLCTLQANLAVNDRIASIFSDYDANIPAGSRLEGAHNVRLDQIGHFRIVADRGAHRAVLDFLADLSSP